jgi:predicted Zn-dependent protease
LHCAAHHVLKGKSSALDRLTKDATKEGFDVYAAPEVATLLMNAGCIFPFEGSTVTEGKSKDSIETMVYQFELSLFTLVRATPLCYHCIPELLP